MTFQPIKKHRLVFFCACGLTKPLIRRITGYGIDIAVKLMHHDDAFMEIEIMVSKVSVIMFKKKGDAIEIERMGRNLATGRRVKIEKVT